MLNNSASASSSNARNFLPCLCFGLLICWFRGAGLDLALPPLLPLRLCPPSLEKNCCVAEPAGLLWPEAVAALDDEAADLEGMVGGWLDMANREWSGGGRRCSAVKQTPELSSLAAGQ